MRSQADLLQDDIKAYNPIPFETGEHKRNTEKGRFDVSLTLDDDLGYIVYEPLNSVAQYFAKLTFYSLKSLKQSNDYKNGIENKESETLISKWKTRRINNNLVIYSDDCKTAYNIYSADINGKIFQMLLDEIDIEDDAYFQEKRFCKLLTRHTNLTIEQLRHARILSDDRFSLIFKDPITFIRLIRANISLEQIKLIPYDLFYLIFKQPEFFDAICNGDISIPQLKQIDAKKISRRPLAELNLALKFLTVTQILGLSHQPRPIEIFNKTNVLNKSKRVSFYSDHGLFNNYPETKTGDDFSYVADGKDITITHIKSKTTFKAKYEIVKIDLFGSNGYVDQINHGAAVLVRLVRDWYCINNENNLEVVNNSRKYYCPALQNLCDEEIQKDFPMEKFCKSPEYTVLSKILFYQEAELIAYLHKQHCNIDKIKENMGIEKLKLFCHKLDDLKFFVEKGIRVADLFENVPLERVEFIFKNIDDAKTALNFVDAKELFGLRNNKDSSPRSEMGMRARK